MNRNQINEAIQSTEQLISSVQQLAATKQDSRRQLLLRGDTKALNSLDRELAELHAQELRGIDRLAVLRDELARVSSEEETARIARYRDQGEAVRESMVQRLKDISAIFEDLVPLMVSQSIEFELLENINTQLTRSGHAPIPSPEDLRQEPVTITDQHTIKETIGGAGIFDAVGKPLTQDSLAPREVARVVPAEHKAGRQPQPLHLTATLPPVFWGGPGWVGGKPLGYYSAVKTPDTVRRETAKASAATAN